MSIDVGKLLNGKVIEFNSKIKDDPGMARMIEGKNRSICISVTDGDDYYSRLENLKLGDFSTTGDGSTDLCVTASSEILGALMSKTMSPIKAYMKGDLKVKASLMDMLLLKKLF
jgi:putative sterol carrier protein